MLKKTVIAVAVSALACAAWTTTASATHHNVKHHAAVHHAAVHHAAKHHVARTAEVKQAPQIAGNTPMTNPKPIAAVPNAQPHKPVAGNNPMK